MSREKTMYVELVFIGDGSKVLACEGDTSLKEQIGWLIQGLTLAYGSRVRSVFLDLEEDKENPLVKRVKEEKRRFPLLLVNGEIKYEEGIPLSALKSHLEGMGLKPVYPMDS